MTIVSEMPARDLPSSMVERISLILDTFDSYSDRIALDEVARRSRLPRSTAHRILVAMAKLNWLDHTAEGYKLGRRLLEADLNDSRLGIRAAAASPLHELHMQTRMVAHLSILDGHEMIYLDKIGGPIANTVPTRVGGRKPAHSTAAGKAVLSCLAPEQVETTFGQHLRRVSANTIDSIHMLHLELNRIRHRGGLAFDQEETAPGVFCLGAAICSPAGPIAALSLSGSLEGATLRRFAPPVMAAALEIKRNLYPGIEYTRRARYLG